MLKDSYDFNSLNEKLLKRIGPSDVLLAKDDIGEEFKTMSLHSGAASSGPFDMTTKTVYNV